MKTTKGYFNRKYRSQAIGPSESSLVLGEESPWLKTMNERKRREKERKQKLRTYAPPEDDMAIIGSGKKA